MHGRLLACALALVLAGCGGGGGGTATPLPADPGASAPTRAEAGSRVAFGLGWPGGDSDVGLQWDFGDGQSSTEARPTHVYTQPGRYDWALTLRNGAGQTSTFRGSLWVGWFNRLDPASCTGSDRGGWCWQWPERPAVSLVDVQFADDRTGTTVDAQGMARLSTDAARTWSAVSLPPPVRAFRMADAQNGWALAGEPLRLLRTRDGARSWSASPLPPPAEPLEGRLLVRGPDSVVVTQVPSLRTQALSAITTDGGRSWVTLVPFHATAIGLDGAVWGKWDRFNTIAQTASDMVLPAPGAPVIAIPGCCESGQVYYGAALVSPRQTVAVTKPFDASTLTHHRSDDGAQTWVRQPARLPAGVVPGALKWLRLFDGGGGWAEAMTQAVLPPGEDERSLLLGTRNGGADWTVIGEWARAPGQGLDVTPIDANTLRAGRRVLLADGRWQDLPTDPAGESTAPTEVRRLPAGGGWLMGYGPVPGQGGRWYVIPGTGSGQALRLPGNAGPEADGLRVTALWFDNPREGLALRSDGVLLATQDGGRQWQTRSTLPGDPYQDPRDFQVKGDTIWATRAGRLLASVDRGATWLAVSTPGLGVVEARLVDARTGFVGVCVGFGDRSGGTCPQRLAATTDSGRSWADRGEQSSFDVTAWADARTGARADRDGRLWHTTDAGLTWVIAGNGPANGRPDVLAVRAPGSSWAQLGGSTLRSDDAGRSWRAVDNLELRQVAFVDTQTLFALTASGLARSRDGGSTWQRTAAPTERPLSALHALDRQTLWLGGGPPATLVTTSTAGD